MLLCAAILFIAIYLPSLILIRRSRRSALIIVHPYCLGIDDKEIEAKFSAMSKSRVYFSQNGKTEFIRKHKAFYSRLDNWLKSVFYGHVIVLEEQSKSDITLLRINTHLHNNIFRKASFQFLKVNKLFMVPTVSGFALPAYTNGYDDLIDHLKKLGIKRIHICGCYLGTTKDGEIPDVGNHYEYYCINDIFYRLHESDCFDVDVATNYSFVIDARLKSR